MREIFDDAIGSSPPSGIDIDAIVARKRRQMVLRSGTMVAVAVCAAAVALTVAAVAVHAVGAGPRTQTAGGGAGNRASATTSASPMPSPAPLPSRPVETPTQVNTRLTSTLTNQLTALLPGVQINDRTTKQAGIAIRPGPNNGPSQSYHASVRLTTSAGSGTFDALSAPRSESPTPSPTGPVTTRPQPPTTCDEFWVGSQTTPAQPDDRQCTASVGPEGQIVLAAIDKPDAQALRYEVVVLWAHSYVDITLENYFEGWENEGDPPDQTFLPTPQLTLAQLITLAENPALSA